MFQRLFKHSPVNSCTNLNNITVTNLTPKDLENLQKLAELNKRNEQLSRLIYSSTYEVGSYYQEDCVAPQSINQNRTTAKLNYKY